MGNRPRTRPSKKRMLGDFFAWMQDRKIGIKDCQNSGHSQAPAEKTHQRILPRRTEMAPSLFYLPVGVREVIMVNTWTPIERSGFPKPSAWNLKKS